LEIRAFLSWSILWKIRFLDKKEIYKDFGNSYRKQILVDVKNLKYGPSSASGN